MIQQAQAALDAANAKLGTVQKGATDDILQAAQSAVDSDKAALASAQAALAALGGSNAADLQAAQAQVDTAVAGAGGPERRRLRQRGARKPEGPSPADIQQAQSALEAAQAQRGAPRRR